jgi:hypothetical protein
MGEKIRPPRDVDCKRAIYKQRLQSQPPEMAEDILSLTFRFTVRDAIILVYNPKPEHPFGGIVT